MNCLSFTVSEGVATLTLQRSTCSNAIDISVIRAVHLALDQIQKGESGAKAVVITGSNDVFCSGLDLHSVDLKTQEARQRAHFEMRLGLVPDAGITFHLARRIGAGRSLSSLMLAEKIDAKTALEWGLAYAVVPAAEVVSRAQAVARKLATGPCAVLGQIRSLHASTFDNSLQEQLRAERSAQEMTLESQDCVEGVRAFFEKREPNFSEH
jgi:enoyl-CoA hydratase/carnithine racemase